MRSGEEVLANIEAAIRLIGGSPEGLLKEPFGNVVRSLHHNGLALVPKFTEKSRYLFLEETEGGL